MSSEERIAASRTVAANPAEVFLIVTDPAMHVEIDGSGMLEAAPGSRRVEAPGDTFVMDMDREPLGDQPMGKYRSVNTVTRIVPDELLEWNVGLPEQGPFGHVYGWEITAVGPGETKVTNYCEWPDIPEFARPHFPIVPLAMLEKSVENLATLLVRQSPAPRRAATGLSDDIARQNGPPTPAGAARGAGRRPGPREGPGSERGRRVEPACQSGLVEFSRVARRVHRGC